MNSLKEILINKNSSCKSIWFMRQAGRYLPEFREIRKKNKNFINLCLNSKISSEITLQPINRFDVDSAIIFSDILMIPYATGQKVEFIEKKGPQLAKFSLQKFLDQDLTSVIEKLKPVYKAIKLTRKNLSRDKSLIGFAGAHWTLLVYMLSLKNENDEINLSKINLTKEEMSLTLKKLNELICAHIDYQIKAGADTIQIFDSWAGKLPNDKIDFYCYNPNKKIVDFCKTNKIPVISFPKGINKKYLDFNHIERPDGLSLDFTIDPIWAVNNLKNVTLQGGLNPKFLLDSEDKMYDEAKKYLDAFKDVPYIFNLGHGIVPETDPEKLKKLINFVKNYK